SPASEQTSMRQRRELTMPPRARETAAFALRTISRNSSRESRIVLWFFSSGFNRSVKVGVEKYDSLSLGLGEKDRDLWMWRWHPGLLPHPWGNVVSSQSPVVTCHAPSSMSQPGPEFLQARSHPSGGHSTKPSPAVKRSAAAGHARCHAYRSGGLSR